MNRHLSAQLIRIVLLVAIQILIARRIVFFGDAFNYVHLFLYPVVIMLLPLRLNTMMTIVVAFFIGLSVDLFYQTPGVHASACVFTGYFRSHVLRWMEPDRGYPVHIIPSRFHMGMPWFIQYSAILLGGHILWYYIIDVFTFVFIWDIILKSFFSFLISFVFLFIYQVLFNSKL